MDELNRIKTLIGFLEADPNDSFSAHALALEYVKVGELEKARVLWLKLLRANPQYVGSYYHLAKLYEQLNDVRQARSVFESGLEVARNQNEKRTQSELQQALDELDDE